MSQHSNKLIALALVGACSFGVWKLGSALLSDEAQGTEHTVNQLWIDHVPRDDRDMITHMVMLDHPQGKFGAVGRSSQWRHIINVFKWNLEGDKLGLFFPQDRARGQFTVKTWDCAGEAPAPFELCMKLTNDKGNSWTLYSREDWHIEPQDVRSSLEDIIDDEPTLSGLLDSFDEDQAEAAGDLDLDLAQSWSLVSGF
jgi:hypothetical protein